MKIIIAGSRTIKDISIIEEVMNTVYIPCAFIEEIVSGTARGVDKLCEQWATNNGIKVTRFPADWNKYGRSAGYIRNKQMAEYSDYLIAIWDGKSKGTKHMIDLMDKLGKPAYVYFNKTYTK